MKAWKLLFFAVLAAVVVAGVSATVGQYNVGEPGAGRIEIRLQQANFDPLFESPRLHPQLASRSARNRGGYYLVQFNGPIKKEWHADLEAQGATVLDYVPDYAYIVRLQAGPRGESAPSALYALDAVRWVGEYAPAYRVANHLVEAGVLDSARSDEPIELVVRAFVGEPGSALREHFDGVEATIEEESVDRGDGNLFRITAPAGAVAELARVPGIAWIEQYAEPELLNEVARSDLIIGKDKLESTLGLYGEGQAVGVVDTGFSTGDMADHHLDFEGRLLGGLGVGDSMEVFTGCSNDDWRDTHGHGTHVAGSVLGSGVRGGSDPTNQQYAGSNAGIAPEALLFAWGCTVPGLLGPGLPLPTNIYDVFEWLYNFDDRLRISNNSWGAPVSGAYNANSRSVDRMVWDFPDMVLVFAAGNDGTDGDADGVVDPMTVGAPASAKSVIAVGASENLRPDVDLEINRVCPTWDASSCVFADRYPVDPIASDEPADDSGGMVAFSSRGPTQDGRLKPDIVAPGSMIISTLSEAAPQDEVYETYYRAMSGTSMAAPLVSGGSAVVREFYSVYHGINPSAALVKATLINGAFDMTPGQYGEGPTQDVTRRPDIHQGWGRMDLPNTLLVDDLSGSDRSLRFNEHDGLETDGSFSLEEVFIGGEPLRVTLVWSDYPGLESADGALVNDLDLEVIAPDGTTYQGNHMFDGDAPDRVNNVEGIDVAEPVSGIYTITVRGFNVPEGPQPFALVLSGNTSPAIIEPAAAAFCTADDDSADFAIELTEAFGDSTALSVTGLPPGTGGAFAPNPVVRPDTESVFTLSGIGTSQAGDYTVELHFDDGELEVPVSLAVTLYETVPATVPATPADGAVDVDLQPLLSWEEADPQPPALQYRVEVSTDDGFNNIVIDEMVMGGELQLSENLASLTRYYWRVRASNSCGETWSDTFEFRTRARPEIHLDPTAISFEVPFLGGADDTLEITNTGTRNLLWELEVSAVACGEDTVAVPWLSVDQTSGNNPTGVTAPVAVTADAANGPLSDGEYSAFLCISSNDEDTPLRSVPVVLSVDDDDAEELTVQVRSTGHCAAGQSPLEGVPVTIVGQNHSYEGVTGSDGDYTIRINAGENPLEISAAAADHVETTVSGVTAPDTVSLDLALEAGCATVEPETFEETLTTGDAESFSLDVRNHGGGAALSWEVQTAPVSCDEPGTVDWLTGLSPSAGTLPPDGGAAVTFDVDTASLYHGEFEALICISSDDEQRPMIEVPFVLTVIDPGVGFIEGVVTSAGVCGQNEDSPLRGATVSTTGAGAGAPGLVYEATTDSDGFYRLLVSEDDSPLDITFSAGHHADADESGVTVVGTETTTVSPELSESAACIEVDPEELSATLGNGQSTGTTVEIGNFGNLALDWELMLEDDPGGVLAVSSDGDVASFSPRTGALIDPALFTLVKADITDETSFDILLHPSNSQQMLISGGDTIGAYSRTGEFLGDFVSIPDAEFTGMAIHPQSGEIMVLNANADDPEVIHVFDHDGQLVRKFGSPSALNFLSLSPVSILVRDEDILVSAATAIGFGQRIHRFNHDEEYLGGFSVGAPTPFSSHSSQLAIDIDDESVIEVGLSNVLTSAFGHISWYDSSGQFLEEFVDSDGLTALTGFEGIHVLPDGNFLLGDRAGVFIYDRAASQLRLEHDVPVLGHLREIGSGCEAPPDWLSIDPTSGSIAAGAAQTLTFTFDADGLVAGEYQTTLCIESNDPSVLKHIPVSLTVLPEDYGTIEGTVQSLGHCNAESGTLAGAEVTLAGQVLETDENGVYRTWLPDSMSPLDITVNADGHLPSTSTVSFTGGDVVVENFDLLLEVPCAATVPDSLSLTLDEDETAYGNILLSNADGNALLTWQADTATSDSWDGDPARDVFVPIVRGDLDCDDPDSVPWLSIAQLFGNVPAGGMQDMRLDLDTTGMAPGQYEAGLCVFSNDPVNPVLPLPISLQVRERADIPDPLNLEVDPSVLDFDEVTVGESAVLSFNVSNAAAGEQSMTLSAVTLSRGTPDFELLGGTCAAGETTLQWGDGCTIEVRFNPGAEGSFTGQVSIVADDGEAAGQSVTVELRGSGAEDARAGEEIFKDRFEQQ